MTPGEIDALPDDPRELKAMMRRIIAERDDAIRTLRLHLTKRFGPRIETLDPKQLALFADEVKSIERQAATETVTVPSHTRRKGGPKPLPESLPRETVVHELSAAERACPCCSKERPECNRSRQEVVEIEPAKLKIVVHETVHYLCPECSGQHAKAKKPSLPLPKSYAGASLLAYVAVSKFADHAPLYRQEGMLARSGLALSRSTHFERGCGWMLGGAELLLPLTELMRRDVLLSRVIQSDDTTIPTLGLVKGRAKDARLWCYVGDADHRHAVFEYTVSREGKWPQRWLQGFSGYLQTDAFAGYGALCTAPGHFGHPHSGHAVDKRPPQFSRHSPAFGRVRESRAVASLRWPPVGGFWDSRRHGGSVGYARSLIVPQDAGGIYHCYSRCVRRERLLESPERVAVLERRLCFLSTRVFAVDLIEFKPMGNHVHAIVRTHPENEMWLSKLSRGKARRLPGGVHGEAVCRSHRMTEWCSPH